MTGVITSGTIIDPFCSCCRPAPHLQGAGAGGRAQGFGQESGQPSAQSRWWRSRQPRSTSLPARSSGSWVPTAPERRRFSRCCRGCCTPTRAWPRCSVISRNGANRPSCAGSPSLPATGARSPGTCPALDSFLLLKALYGIPHADFVTAARPVHRVARVGRHRLEAGAQPVSWRANESRTGGVSPARPGGSVSRRTDSRPRRHDAAPAPDLRPGLQPGVRGDGAPHQPLHGRRGRVVRKSHRHPSGPDSLRRRIDRTHGAIRLSQDRSPSSALDSRPTSRRSRRIRR